MGTGALPNGNGLYIVNGLLASPSIPAKVLNAAKGWTMDPLTATATFTVVAATVYGFKAHIPGSGSTTVSLATLNYNLVTKAGSTLTHAFAGLLTSAGALIGMTADQASSGDNWSSTGSNGSKSTALASGPFTHTPTGVDDYVFVVFYVGTSAGTLPAFGANVSIGANQVNAGTAAATRRVWTQAVADTATPFAALAMASNVAAAQAPSSVIT